MTHRSPRLLALLLAVVAGCAGSADDAAPATAGPPPSTTSSPAGHAAETGSVVLGPPDRPAQLVAPDEVTAPAPLLVLLHGYGGNAAGNDAYLGVSDQARSRGLYVLLPEGTAGPEGVRFWDATGACCNFTGTPVDDVADLQGLIEQAVEARPIDPERVYVFGHSNGGFMTYRLACELADQVAAVASLAGTDHVDEHACDPSEAVSVLHLHGSDDELVRYGGGPVLSPFGDEVVEPGPSRAYPGAADTVVRWASRSGCSPEPVEGRAVDLDAGIDGAETVVTRFVACDGGAAVQLDRIEGGRHVPRLARDQVGVHVLDWLLDQAR